MLHHLSNCNTASDHVWVMMNFATSSQSPVPKDFTGLKHVWWFANQMVFSVLFEYSALFGWIVSQAHKILVSSEMDLPHRMIHYNLNFLAWENKPSSTVQESWERNYHETWWCTVFGWCFLICTKAKNKKWGRDQSENKKIMVGFAGLSFVWRNQHCGSPGDKRSNSNWTWPKRLEMWFGRFNLWQSNMAAKIP